MTTETIILGGGCFWCTEAVFSMLNGVVRVIPGYAGGTTPNPTYEQVCSGTTGHAEVVKVEYDSSIASLSRILSVFFKSHDPTTKDRPRHDIGSQYRSLILCMTQQQKKEAILFVKSLQQQYAQPIVTEIKMLDNFYPAEEEHHNYFKKHPEEAYCQVVIAPKVEKMKNAKNKKYFNSNKD